METTLNQLEIIINQKRTIHGEPFINKVMKTIMNLPKKRISQRELMRRFSDKRLIDFLAIRDKLKSNYNIKTLHDSHQKIIYYKEVVDEKIKVKA